MRTNWTQPALLKAYEQSCVEIISRSTLDLGGTENLTLAFGIGANTAIFTLLDELALRALPVPHPEQLVRFGARVPGNDYAALPMFQESNGKASRDCCTIYKLVGCLAGHRTYLRLSAHRNESGFLVACHAKSDASRCASQLRQTLDCALTRRAMFLLLFLLGDVAGNRRRALSSLSTARSI